MLPLFDPNRILLHSSSMRKYMVRVNKLDNNMPTHKRTYTHIGPGPGVEARDAARPGRARRGGCGQLLRRAAETPEHLAQVVVPGRKSDWSSAEIRPGRLLSLSEESVPAPSAVGAKLHGPTIPPPAPVKTHPSLRSGNLACLSGSGGSKSKFKF